MAWEQAAFGPAPPFVYPWESRQTVVDLPFVVKAVIAIANAVVMALQQAAFGPVAPFSGLRESRMTVVV